MLPVLAGRTLGRADRLGSTREFQDVSRRGRRGSSRSFVVLMASRSARPQDGLETEFSRIGLTVSRRVGGAVVRNRVKRRLRVWFSQSAARSAGAFDWVVIARPSAADLPSSAIRAELDGACGRILAKASG